MSIKLVTNSAIGIAYQYIIDNELDRHNLPINSYFYENSSKQVWFKEGVEVYLNFWEYKTYTSTSINNIRSKQIEVDFGSLPVSEKLFTITDELVKTTNKIIASIAYDKPTNKDLDELEMDDLSIKAGNASNGTFKLFIKEANGSYLADKFKINYTVI